MADLPGPDVEIRVIPDGAVAFGPAQAKTREEIRLTGLISAAQRRLGFGYVYTWKLVAAMNDRFTPPLVSISRGGKRGGGASLTKQGLKFSSPAAVWSEHSSPWGTLSYISSTMRRDRPTVPIPPRRAPD